MPANRLVEINFMIKIKYQYKSNSRKVNTLITTERLSPQCDRCCILERIQAGFIISECKLLPQVWLYLGY